MDLSKSSKRITDERRINLNDIELKFKSLKIDKHNQHDQHVKLAIEPCSKCFYYHVYNPFKRSRTLKHKKKYNNNHHHRKPILAESPEDEMDRSLVSQQQHRPQSHQISSTNKLPTISLISDKMASLCVEDGYRQQKKDNQKQKCVQKITSLTSNQTCALQAAGTQGMANSTANTNSSTNTSNQHLSSCDTPSVVELAAYLDETLYIPKKMSFMAEMMYT